MKKEAPVTVRRITVDERLSDDLIRLEVCELVRTEKSGEFKDEPEYWQDLFEKEEEEVLVRPDESESKSQIASYTEMMQIPKNKKKEFPWKDLKEGQVFLIGEFETDVEETKSGKVTHYLARPGAQTFERIDDDVYVNTKSLYYEVLANTKKNA